MPGHPRLFEWSEIAQLDPAVEPDPTEKPEPQPDVSDFPAWLVPPLCNVYQPNECFQWYRLVYLRGDEDLTLDEYSTRSLGKPVKWTLNECGDFEPESLLNPTWPHIPTGVGCWSFTTQWLEWGLLQGLCPGQPFLVWFDKPVYYQSGGYGDSEEWDVEQAWDIVGRMPRSDAQASQSWDRVLAQIHQVRDLTRGSLRELLHRRAHDLSAMSIKFKHVGMYGNIVVSMLCTEHIRARWTTKQGSLCLVEGRCEKGDHEVAYENLVKEALERFPHLNRERLDCLRHGRRYRPSSWERIVEA